MSKPIKREQQLLDLRKQVENEDGTVFFAGEDEDAIDKYKVKVIADEKKKEKESYESMRDEVLDRISSPSSGPVQTLNDLEDIALAHGFDTDEIEMILLNMC